MEQYTSKYDPLAHPGASYLHLHFSVRLSGHIHSFVMYVVILMGYG